MSTILNMYSVADRNYNNHLPLAGVHLAGVPLSVQPGQFVRVRGMAQLTIPAGASVITRGRLGVLDNNGVVSALVDGTLGYSQIGLGGSGTVTVQGQYGFSAAGLHTLVLVGYTDAGDDRSVIINGYAFEVDLIIP